MLVLINVVAMLAMVAVLYNMQKKYVKFTKRVFIALGMGVVFGGILQVIYGAGSDVVTESIHWFDVIGRGYVNLLQMIVMPLIMVSITSAIINLKAGDSLGKMGGTIIALLVGTTAVAALFGVLASLGFGLSAEGLASGAAEAARTAKLQDMAASKQHITSTIVSVIPRNPFYAITGQGSNSTLSVVLFSAFIGISTLGIKKKKPQAFELFKDMVNAAHDVVMRMVTLVLRLTPFGVLALMTKVVAGSNVQDILNLIKFVGASYAALFAVFVMHMVLVMMVGLNPATFIKKSLPVLTFAFSSRSSAGTIPLNVQTQREKLGVSEGVANLSASLGATIGQNGCAGIYPAMLAIMIAATPGSGIEINFSFIVTLVVVTAVSSFGVAGVGGGATFAALIVLSSLGLPVGLVGLLISIEPLIDMGRTAINVSGAMTTGVVTGKLLGQMDVEAYNSDNDLAMDEA